MMGGFSMIAYFRDLMSRLRRKPPTPTVRVSDEGMMLFDGDRPGVRFAWSEVQEIVTFKRDLYIYDDIRLAFRVDGRWVEVSEETEGWPKLVAAIERHFPTIPPDRYQAVMLPPFEACFRVLYEAR